MVQTLVTSLLVPVSQNLDSTGNLVTSCAILSISRAERHDLASHSPDAVDDREQLVQNGPPDGLSVGSLQV